MIKQMLCKHVATFNTEWDQLLHFCAMSICSGINTSTGVSLAQLFLGHKIRFISDVATCVGSGLALNHQACVQQLLHDISEHIAQE